MQNSTLSRLVKDLHLKRFHALGWDGYAMMALTNLCLIVTFGLPLVPVFLHILKLAKESPVPCENIDALVIFGKKLADGHLSAEFITRLEKSLSLHQGQMIYILGGATTKDAITEASAAKNWLIARGIKNECIKLEEKSVNTLENLQHLREFLQPNLKRLIFVSSNTHLARVQLIAGRLKLTFLLCAADDKFIASRSAYTSILIESYLFFYYLVGEWFATTTNNKGMLRRIR